MSIQREDEWNPVSDFTSDSDDFTSDSDDNTTEESSFEDAMSGMYDAVQMPEFSKTPSKVLSDTKNYQKFLTTKPSQYEFKQVRLSKKIYRRMTPTDKQLYKLLVDMIKEIRKPYA